MTKKLISVVIPTYNEKENISLLLQFLSKKLVQYNYEIVVIDDYSLDGTVEILKQIAKKNNKIKFFLNPPPRGLARSILLGWEKSKGDIIIGMDADFNHDPKIINTLIKNIENQDLVIASRFIKGGGMQNKMRFYMTYLFNLLLRIFFNFPLTDNASGYYAIKKNVANKLPLQEIFQGYGEYHLRLVYLANKNNLKITELPVFYQRRKYGKSKSNLLKMFVNYLRVAWELRYK